MQNANQSAVGKSKAKPKMLDSMIDKKIPLMMKVD